MRGSEWESLGAADQPVGRKGLIGHRIQGHNRGRLLSRIACAIIRFAPRLNEQQV
jgi:hypothetical protein